MPAPICEGRPHRRSCPPGLCSTTPASTSGPMWRKEGPAQRTEQLRAYLKSYRPHDLEDEMVVDDMIEVVEGGSDDGRRHVRPRSYQDDCGVPQVEGMGGDGVVGVAVKQYVPVQMAR